MTFPIPNSFIDNWLKKLSSCEVMVCFTFFRFPDYRFFTLPQISNITKLSKNTIVNSIRSLIDLRFIEEIVLEESEILKIILSKIPQNLKVGTEICEWCKSTTFILHSHHYPIRKCEGGTKLVDICPSCHCEYHYLLETKKFRLNPSIEYVLSLGGE
jgi:hypothetical protein